jgi:hypothetical protein
LGYLAEDDKNLGLNVWEEKIQPRLQNSLATIVFWTANAHDSPGNILKEIEISQTLHKRLILILEEGIDKPESFSTDFEYHTLRGKGTRSELKQIARVIHRTYLKGMYFRNENP